MTSDQRAKALRAAEMVGFALNISGLRAIYAHRLEQTELSAEEIDQRMIERGHFWRSRVLAWSLAIGTLGYFLRDYSVFGTVLMYGCLLAIAVHLNSSWMAKPGSTARHLLGFPNKAQPDSTPPPSQ